MAGNFRPGVRTEIVFTLTVLMVAAVALVGILFLKIEERNLLQQKIRSGKQMIAALQKFLQDLDPQDLQISRERIPPEKLQRLVNLFAQSQILSNFSVVNGNFQVLADSRPERVGTVFKDEALKKAMAAEKVLTHSAGGEVSFLLMKKTPLLLSAPLIIQGKKVGGLQGELPLDDLRETHSRSQATVFLYIIFDALLLIVVGSLLLSRVIVKPLKKLVQMSEKIAEGDLESMASPAGGDEIGKLFSSFNHMASRLREDRVKMEEYIRSLERVNRELRQAQNEVIRTEKLASIGRLAAGVAHEVGNPTSAIMGYLDLLAMGGVPEADQKEILQRAGHEAERIRRIIRELLDFARPSPEKEEEVNVNTVILNAFSLLSHQKKIWANMEFGKQFQEDLPPWRGDAHQLQQVMINLFLNAADAMSLKNPSAPNEKRKLCVTTRSLGKEEGQEFRNSLFRRRKEDSPELHYSLLRAQGTIWETLPNDILPVIRVDVADSGPGIPKENLGKIFDPFFSTKPPGEGTGLGLAICLRILESYGGRISVQSKEGEGTTFTILLPVFPNKGR